MRPIALFPSDSRRRITCVLADIDDTLTVEGRLPPDSYSALWQLHDAGISVIPVTGRPAGWCDLICRQWPVAAVIGENGAFAFFMEDRKLQVLYHPTAPEPQKNMDRLREIAEEVYRAVPGTRAAKDQFSRLFDIAIDFREEPPMLDLDSARRVKSIFESHGAQARISSIHVNAWFGEYNKLAMVRHFLGSRLDLDITTPEGNRRIVFCGDSPNDEPMFEAFENSVGVANVTGFLSDIHHPPAYVTEKPQAEGFAEMVACILDR